VETQEDNVFMMVLGKILLTLVLELDHNIILNFQRITNKIKINSKIIIFILLFFFFFFLSLPYQQVQITINATKYIYNPSFFLSFSLLLLLFH